MTMAGGGCEHSLLIRADLVSGKKTEPVRFRAMVPDGLKRIDHVRCCTIRGSLSVSYAL